MNVQRKATIINEIKYWKDNRLLPDEYCNYLLALYTEGEEISEETEAKSGIVGKINIFSLLFIILNLTLAPSIAFFIFYARPNMFYSIALIILTLNICIGLFFLGLKYYQIDSDYVMVVLLLNIFILSLVIINQWMGQSFAGLMVIFIQLIFWLSLGIRRSSKLLIGMALLGLVVSIISIII